MKGMRRMEHLLDRLAQEQDTVVSNLRLVMYYRHNTILSMIYNMGTGILRAGGDSRRPMYFLITAAFVNIVLDLLFVAVFHWGVLGAAIGTAAATGTGMLVMNRYFRRRVGLNTPRFWLRIRHLLPAMILPGALAIVIAVFLYPTGYFQIAGIACIFVAVYGVSMWLFGLDRYERHLITDPLQKIVRRFKK